LSKRLRQLLSGKIPSRDLAQICNSYDIVGDVAIIRLITGYEKHCHLIAKAIMVVHTSINTVLGQTGAVQGDFRLRELRHIAGQKKMMTSHRESGCVFSVDLERCYFSPRLGNERMRIARQVGSGEVVVNMFAGVGCFSILIAKHSDAEKVYSIDVNPVAIGYMRENVRLNGAYGKVVPILGDAKAVVEKRLSHVADRVLMPLPQSALEYLPSALLALRRKGGWIHHYAFEHVDKGFDTIDRVRLKVAEKLGGLGVAFDFASARIVRSTGPRWCQIVLDIVVRQ
jgi:tRNA (guanine37-N1)-methyltransferase